MSELLTELQLHLMVALSGACGTIAVFVLIARNIPLQRRIALMLLETSCMLLLFFDLLAYSYAGSTDHAGYIMVRFTNFMVYELTLMVVMALNLYLSDLMKHEVRLKELPKGLTAVNIIICAGLIMVVVSQFNGLYYYFDDQNCYHRGRGFLISYIFPVFAPAIQLYEIIRHRKSFSRRILISLILFITIPVTAAFIQIFTYGLSVINISIVGVAIFVYVATLYDIDKKIERANNLEIQFLQEERKSMQRLFDQTASAFVNALDERDGYAKGHSARVAEYAGMIARESGKSEKECDEIYFAGLMHDIGRIGVPESIIHKEGELTFEEHKVLEQTPVIGDKILSGITEYPFLRTAAHYVNERYDGLGYPDRLKGDEIPEVARIIAVADHYATMTASQRDRAPYPQIAVREDLIKNSGTVFDPRFARIMVSLIDSDPEYLMQDHGEYFAHETEKEIKVKEYRSSVSRGILIEQSITEISFSSRPGSDTENEYSTPSLVIFDSFDGRTHTDAETIEAFSYLEYGEIWPDGHIICTAARNMEVTVTEKEKGGDSSDQTGDYTISAGRFEDHARIVIESKARKAEIIIALQDSSKYAYIGLTGENCCIENIKVEKKNVELWSDDIPRIAPKITYTDRLEGDIPNIQIDSIRSAATEGIPLKNDLKIEFHAISLPSSHLIWHCPYVILYTAEDKKVFGTDYREYAVIKLNGESAGDNDIAENTINVNKDEFGGWEQWKRQCKEGRECTVNFQVKNNTVITTLLFNDLVIENTTVIKDNANAKDLLVSLSGDQCAITDIRIL